MQEIWFERGPSAPLLARYAGRYALTGPDLTGADPFQGVETAQAIVAGVRLYDAAVFARARQLLVLARLGIGYDRVDIAAATAQGVAICNAPDGPTISTAECALTLMLAIARDLPGICRRLRQQLRQGADHDFYSEYRGLELNGRQLGLVGLGRIGTRLAKMALAIGMRVACYDPFVKHEHARRLGVEPAASLTELLADSDVVSLHLPLTDETRHIMNAERFAQMKRGAILINTARGGHVDEKGLLAALERGQLAGAGLDVTDPEPPLPDNPLLNRDDVIITPHIASGTIAGKQRIFEHTLANIEAALAGELPPNLLNPEVWPRVLERRAQQTG